MTRFGKSTLLAALLMLGVASDGRAQWIADVDEYSHIDFERDVRVQLASDLGRDGMAPGDAMALASRTAELPGVIVLLPKFCDGCQMAHYWVVNLSAEPLFAIDIHVTIGQADDERVVQSELFLPLVPARHAIRLGFPIPWPMQETIDFQIGTPLPRRRTTTVSDDRVLPGLPMGVAAATAIAERDGTFSLAPGDEVAVAGGHTESIPFVFRHLEEEPRAELARWLVEALGGTRVRELAEEHLVLAFSTQLVGALPADELPTFVDAALSDPGVLARILRDTSPEQAAALAELMGNGTFEAQDALIRAAMRTEDLTRLSVLSDALGDKPRDPQIVGRGWGLIQNSEAIQQQVTLLRRLEISEAHTRAAAQKVARRYLATNRFPSGLETEIERLRAAVPEPFDAETTSVLTSRGPFDADALRAGGLDPYEYLTTTLPALDGCNHDEPMLHSIEACGRALAEHEELKRVGMEHGLSSRFASHVRQVLAEQSDPAGRADLAVPLVAAGLDGGPIAEDLCEELDRVVYDEHLWIDAARRIDPSASCVVEADAAILGLSPLVFFVVLGAIVVLLAVAIFGFATLRKRQRRLDAMMDDAGA